MTVPPLSRDSPTLEAMVPRRPKIARFLLAACVVPVLLLVMPAWLHAEYATVEAMRVRARASSEIRVETSMLVADIADTVADQHAFLLTRDPAFRRADPAARREVARAFDRLRDRLSGWPEQERLRARLQALTERTFADTGMLAVDPARNDVRARAHTTRIAEIRRVSARMLALAAIEGEARAAAVEARIAADRAGLWIATGAIGLLTGAAGWLAWRQDTLRYRARLAAYSVAERNRAILDSTVDAIVICDAGGTIETINAATTAMLGYSAREIEARDVAALIDLPGRADERGALIEQVLAHPYLSDRTVRHRDGHEVPVDIALGVMRLPDQTHIVASVRDVSERRRMERIKDELLSTINHELRTPLTAVIGALGLLRAQAQAATPAATARLIDIAENNSHRLIRLINDMLQIDRTRSEQLRLERVPTDLRGVLERAGEGSRGLGEAVGVKIVCDLPDAPAIASIDADRILQVVTNLTSNAVRASPAGGTVTVRLTRDDAGGAALIAVEDDGPGVPSAFRNRIFGRFERAEERSPGTGLGLAICRDIVERHGGRIWFEDRAHGGSRFTFVLALEAAAPTADLPVLVCAGEPGRMTTVRDVLDRGGHAAHDVATTEAASAALASHAYHALLLDLDLPDAAGLQLARAVSAPRDATTPVVILLTPAGRDGPAALDLVDWLEQPVDHGRLREAVRRAAERIPDRPPLVLVLNGDPAARASIAATLGDTAQTVLVGDLDEARSILDTIAPDIAVVDPHLAAVDGADRLPLLVDPAGLTVPTIVLCAQGCSIACTAQIETVLVAAPGRVPDLAGTVRRALRKPVGVA